jgi:hypothetical protein
MSDPNQGQPSKGNAAGDLDGAPFPWPVMLSLGAFGGFALYLVIMEGNQQRTSEGEALLSGVAGAVLALVLGLGIRALEKSGPAGRTTARWIFCLILLGVGVLFLIVVVRPRLSRPNLPDHPPLVAPRAKTLS